MNQAEDVGIVLGHKNYYKFHSGTLIRNSTLLAGMLTEPNAVKLSGRAKEAGITIRWMVELANLPCDEYPAGRLELVKLTRTGERADNRNGLVVNENGRIPRAEKIFSYYKSILYTFYNKPLAIDNSDMAAVLVDCDGLLDISDYLGCTTIISRPIEVALIKHGQNLFRAISNAPLIWTDLAVRIRSEFLFDECMIHLVGNWGVLKSQPNTIERLQQEQQQQNQNQQSIPSIVSLIEKNHTRLLEQCRKLDLSIVNWYPAPMKRPVEDLPIKREAYSKDILLWMAMMFFRHWFSQRLASGQQGRHGPDAGFALYKQLGAGPDTYMDSGVVAKFHELFPMTKKALCVVERHLDEIKRDIKGVVERSGILKSVCQLDVHRFPVPYLTCMVLDKGEYPWKGGVVTLKRGYESGDESKSEEDEEKRVRTD